MYDLYHNGDTIISKLRLCGTIDLHHLHHLYNLYHLCRLYHLYHVNHLYHHCHQPISIMISISWSDGCSVDPFIHWSLYWLFPPQHVPREPNPLPIHMSWSSFLYICSDCKTAFDDLMLERIWFQWYSDKTIKARLRTTTAMNSRLTAVF